MVVVPVHDERSKTCGAPPFTLTEMDCVFDEIVLGLRIALEVDAVPVAENEIDIVTLPLPVCVPDGEPDPEPAGPPPPSKERPPPPHAVKVKLVARRRAAMRSAPITVRTSGIAPVYGSKQENPAVPRLRACGATLGITTAGFLVYRVRRGTLSIFRKLVAVDELCVVAVPLNSYAPMSQTLP